MARENLEQVAVALYESGSLSFGPVDLRGGGTSPYYIDLGKVNNYPEHRKTIIEAYANMFTGLKFDQIAGVPQRITPLASCVAFILDKPYLTPRVGNKDHGKKDPFIGQYKPGEVVVLVDDVITKGGSLLEAARFAQSFGLKVQDLLALIDREEGGIGNLEREGFRVHTFTGVTELIECMGELGLIKDPTLSETLGYIRNKSQSI